MDNTMTYALSTSSIDGTDVENPQGENLGHIKDLMIDVNTGRVLYAVISFGGIFGIGDKLFAVPLQSFTIDTEDEKFILDVNQEFLEDAPGFDKSDWPATNDVDFNTRVYRHYSIDPYWVATPAL